LTARRNFLAGSLPGAAADMIVVGKVHSWHGRAMIAMEQL